MDSTNAKNRELELRNELLESKNGTLTFNLNKLTKENEQLKKKVTEQKERFSFDESTMDCSGNNLEDNKQKFATLGTRLADKGTSYKLQWEESLLQFKKQEEECNRLKSVLMEFQTVDNDNEQLEIEVNVMRNQRNLDGIKLEETQNMLDREKTLRLLDKEGIKELQEKIFSFQKQIGDLETMMNKLEREKVHLEKVVLIAEHKLHKHINHRQATNEAITTQLRQTIICLKEEVGRLKENQVFVLDCGGGDPLERAVYGNLLNMIVPEKQENNMWFGDELNISHIEDVQGHCEGGQPAYTKHNQIVPGNKLFAKKNVPSKLMNFGLFNQDSFSEMESILKSKLDILEDERVTLEDDIRVKDSMIQDLQQKFKNSKQILEENLKIMEKKTGTTQVAKVFNSGLKAKEIHGKLVFFNKLLKICYGACIDLFLGMDQPSLVKLEKKLNNCLQVNKEINELVFGI